MNFVIVANRSLLDDSALARVNASISAWWPKYVASKGRPVRKPFEGFAEASERELFGLNRDNYPTRLFGFADWL